MGAYSHAAVILRRYRRFIPVRSLRNAIDIAIAVLEMPSAPDYGGDILAASERIVKALEILDANFNHTPIFINEAAKIQDAANLIHWAIIVEGAPDNVDANVWLESYINAAPRYCNGVVRP